MHLTLDGGCDHAKVVGVDKGAVRIIKRTDDVAGAKGKDQPKSENIVNFIPLLEPRDPKITEDVLYQTVVKQVEILSKYK